jgi:hypothetical protein
MWFRFLGACALALALQIDFQTDNARALRQKYGAPISGSYLIRSGVIASARYGPNGDVCEIVLSPKRLWNSTLDNKQVIELTEELVPTNERGKVAIGGLINGACPTNDCGGADYEWEKVSIIRWGSNDQVHYVTIQWRRDECRPRLNN